MDEVNNLDEANKLKGIILMSELKEPSVKECSILNQNDQVKWQEHRDTNSKCFHSRIRWGKIKNELKGMEMDDKMTEDLIRVR